MDGLQLYDASALFDWSVLVFHSIQHSLIRRSGLKVAEQYGNFYKRSQTDLEFGVLDADKSITVLFGHSTTLDERHYAYIQSAVLYTTATGQRMVRTCNLALPVVSLAMNVFRYADADAAVAYWFRKGGCS